MTKEYFEEYAENLGQSLRSVDSIMKFTKNTALIGQYTEKVVMEFIEKSILPLKLCTGGIISPESFQKDKLPQLDIIIYSSNPLPPIFKIYDFALVPKNSVFSIIEIKKTDYDKGLDDLKKKLTKLNKIKPSHCGKPLGIICVVEKNKPSGENKLTELIKNENCIYLIEKKGDELIINLKGIFELINYIIDCRVLHSNNINNSKISVDHL
ncbi:hypothetical protein D1815_03340 [Aquimarina sp. AD1]|nr:hypothetical protein D1815_03340 [Aquimarina sp. AD1]